MPQVSVLIPTYNEKENIRPLLHRLEQVLSGTDYEIIVVDDNSPDGTAQAVQDFDSSRVTLYERKGKQGLGSAYKFAWERAAGDKIIQMDADFSHKPQQIPQLVDALDNYDVAIGSRYIEGGRRQDPWYRRIFPQLGNFLYKKLLDIEARDTTSGFRAYRKKALTDLDKEELPDDFSFQAAVLFQLSEQGATVKEIPIEFEERKYGQTKYSFRQLLGNLQLLFSLTFHKHFGSRFLKFCLVGLSGVLVNMGLLYALTEFGGLFYLYSSAIAIESSIITNFLLNEHWTWHEIGSRSFKALSARLAKYNLVSGGGLIINLSLLYLLTSLFGLFYLVSNLFAVGGATLWNFFVNKNWTWNS